MSGSRRARWEEAPEDLGRPHPGWRARSGEGASRRPAPAALAGGPRRRAELLPLWVWEGLLGGGVSLAGLGWASVSWARGCSEVWGSEGVVLLGSPATRRGR